MKIQLSTRIDEKLKTRLEKLAARESKKTGFNITVSGLVEKIILEYVKTNEN